MGHDSNEIRHLDLIRFEHAAGTAFGCIDEDEATSAPRTLAPTAFAVATFATAVAATLTYLI
jgi:hypothetical protein